MPAVNTPACWTGHDLYPRTLGSFLPYLSDHLVLLSRLALVTRYLESLVGDYVGWVHLFSFARSISSRTMRRMSSSVNEFGVKL
jgi:hypothetical protein